MTGVHLLLLCETRQSLPAKPIVLVLATIGVARLARADVWTARSALQPHLFYLPSRSAAS
jgi:hypothetical protein